MEAYQFFGCVESDLHSGILPMINSLQIRCIIMNQVHTKINFLYMILKKQLDLKESTYHIVDPP